MTSGNACVRIEELSAFVEQTLATVGMSAEDARTCARVLVETDAMGVFTHGTKLLRDYVQRLRAGGMRASGRPRIEREGPAWAIVDGDAAMGQLIGSFAMKVAIEKAKRTGISYVGARDSNHFGAAGYYAWMAAREGLIGVAMANDIPSVAAPGSRKAVTGSNPLAYAVPTSGDPILLDMAISTVAGGKVYAAHQRGEPIADNWIIGPDGKPTTDGSLYPIHAALAPMAGHKGYGIALLIETLSAVITGASITWRVGSWIWGDATKPTDHGAAFIAVDVDTIVSRAEFLARVDGLVAEIHAAPTAEGVERILVPGEREWTLRRQALENGIVLPADVVAKLQLLARETGIHPDWLARRADEVGGGAG